MKKLMMCFLVGILLIGTVACGNKTAEKTVEKGAEKDVTAQFKNSVFVGDSITEGFAVNEIFFERMCDGWGRIYSRLYL